MARIKQKEPIESPGPRSRRCARMYAGEPPPSSSSSEDEFSPSSSSSDGAFTPPPKRCVRCELLAVQIVRLEKELREERLAYRQVRQTLHVLGDRLADKNLQILTLEGENHEMAVTWASPEEQTSRLMVKGASDRALVELQDEKMELADDLTALMKKYHLDE